MARFEGKEDGRAQRDTPPFRDETAKGWGTRRDAREKTADSSPARSYGGENSRRSAFQEVL